MEDRVSNTYNWTKLYITYEISIAPQSKWCSDNIGKRWTAIPYDDRDGVWAMFWNGTDRNYCFQFKYEEDAVRFALRWK